VRLHGRLGEEQERRDLAGVLPGWVGIALPLVTMVAIVGSEFGTSALIGVFLIVVGRRLATASAAGFRPVPDIGFRLPG
jgi:hypothetical protein